MNAELNFALMVPEFVVILAAMAILLVDAFTHDESREVGEGDPRALTAWLGFGGAVAALVWLGYRMVGQPDATAFYGLFVVDAFALYFKAVVLVGAALSLLLVDTWLKNQNMSSGSTHALVLFATAGMMYMISAGDMVMLFLGLEVMSIPIYCLAGSLRWDARSTEAAVKYLVLGSFGSAIFLFGMALLYGFQGLVGGTPTTELEPLRQTILGVSETMPPYAAAGGVFLLTGLLFKISAAPFHMWTPDVYEGSPTGVTAFMSVAVKAATAAAILRVFGGGVLEQLNLEAFLWAIAALTMVVGNVVALTQANVKRMLAYSSIAHGGYILVGVLAGTAEAEAGIMYYVMAYTLGNIGAFGVLVYLSRRGHEVETFEQLQGLGARYPLVGVVMLMSMLSLIGIPPLAGFFGKFTIFRAAIAEGYIGLSVLAMLTSAVSVGYYLKPLVSMFMKEPLDATFEAPVPSLRLALGLAVATAGVLWLGLMPDDSLRWAADAVLTAAR